jgi:predicted enzyme related to lactoylglutathione lyase
VIAVERVDFVPIPTRDPAQARRFYGELLGLPESSSSADSVWFEFETSNVTLGLFQPEKLGLEFVPATGVAVRVPDVDEARARLEAEGVEFRGETIDSGVCHLAVLTDPDGNRVLIHRRYAPFPDGTRP